MRKKDKGKILAVLVAVMLILSCMSAGMAFADTATATPTITNPTAGDISVSGTATPGASVVLTVSGAVYTAVIADGSGDWTVSGLTALTTTDTLSATAILSPDTLSNLATGTVEAAPVQTATPTITNPTAGDISVSGTATPGASVVLTVSGAVYTAVIADGSGDWTVSGLTALTTTDTLSATAILSPDTSSNPATATVVAASIISGGGGGSVAVYTPVVQTEAATVVSSTSITLNGDITSGSGYTVTDYGFMWGTSASSLTNKLDVGTNNQSGAFTDTLSITPGTTYYFEAYATNSYGTADGAVLSYPTNMPAVQTEAATSVTDSSAVLNGDITSGSGYTVTDYGFMWGTSASTLTNELDAGTNNQSGAFTDTLSNLTTGTTYYFEAYATNSSGTADGAVMSFTAGVPTTTTPSAGTAFSDVPTSYWGYNAITSLSSKGIVSGYPDGTFKPDNQITRAEFATILVKALGLSTTGTTGQFTDVTADAWYYGTVNAAASASLVSGMGDNLFAPNALITREQMAVMVAKALGTKAPAVNGTELSAFSDSSTVSSWAVSGMEEAVKAGIVSGMTADTLAPQANATRAQAAAMIYKMLTV